MFAFADGVRQQFHAACAVPRWSVHDRVHDHSDSVSSERRTAASFTQ
jgi:hypothetical protein